MGKTVLILAALAMLASCGKGSRTQFEGEYYRASAKAPRKERQNFVATAGPISRGIEGAAAAAFYEATKHCIKYYGTSDIDFAFDPETPVDQLPRDGDRIVLRGTCQE